MYASHEIQRFTKHGFTRLLLFRNKRDTEPVLVVTAPEADIKELIKLNVNS